MQAIRSAALVSIQQVDSVVQGFESAATGKLQRLRWIQSAFLVSALGLLGLDWLVTRNSVILSLNQTVLQSVTEKTKLIAE